MARGHAPASANGGIPPRASEDTHVPIQEQYDEVRQLIALGKRKGYLLYEEVNELLPSDITSSDELDELFDTFTDGTLRAHREGRAPGRDLYLSVVRSILRRGRNPPTR
jgi:hypothetical protein